MEFSKQVCFPVLPLDRYSIQRGCGYLDDGYYEATINPKTGLGSVHSGVDWNGLGGGNTDEGDPIYCIADGIVTHLKSHRVWGWVAVVHHPQFGVWSQYAHPDVVRCKLGEQVFCAQHIGDIGRGGWNAKKRDWYFYAHLHFEIRTADIAGDDWPSTRYPNKARAEQYVQTTRVNPVVWLRDHGAATTLAEARQRPPAIIQPPKTQIVVPDYWRPVLKPDAARTPTGAWVSLATAKDGEVTVFEVPEYKLQQKGIR